eukprot:symbB.v1.2.040760.t1/scaffold7490.1/size10953/1
MDTAFPASPGALAHGPMLAEEEEPSSATEGTPVEEEPAGKKGVEKVKKVPPEPKRERGREVDKRSGKGRSEKGRAEKGGSEKGRSDKGRGKSKGKSQWEQGRRACPICWQMVVNTKAGMEQHQYWSAEEEEPSSATEGTPVEEEPAGKKGVEKVKKVPPQPKRERGREVDKRQKPVGAGQARLSNLLANGGEHKSWYGATPILVCAVQWLEEARQRQTVGRRCGLCGEAEGPPHGAVECQPWQPWWPVQWFQTCSRQKAREKGREEKKKVPAREKGKASSTKKDKKEKRKRKSSSPEPRPGKKEKKRKDTSSEEEDKGSGRGKGWTKVWHWVKL